MVVALLLKEILDAIPVGVVIAAFLVAVGLQAAGVPVIETIVNTITQVAEGAWNWFVNLLKSEVGL